MIFHKQEIYDLLNERAITYETIEHPPVYTVDEMNALDLPDKDIIAKNLFLRDDKKRNFYLVVVPESKQINLKELRQVLQSRPLSFASEKYLSIYLHVATGAVSPFGALNDDTHCVKVCIDKVYAGKRIGCHPNDNTATVYLDIDDIVTLISDHGNDVNFYDF